MLTVFNLYIQNKLDPVIGRGEEIERVTQILCKRRKNNVCLTGDPGVGKTVIVEGLASRIITGSIPLKLQDAKVFLGESASLCSVIKVENTHLIFYISGILSRHGTVDSWCLKPR